MIMSNIKKYKYINIIILLFILFIFVNYVYSSVLSDYQDQMNKIKQQQQQTTQQLQGIDKDISAYTYDMMDLDEKLTSYTISLNDLQNKIDAVDSKIAEQQKALQESSQKYNSAEKIYAKRLRVIYENGIPSVIDVLFSAKGISDFFSKLNVIDSLLDYDKNLASNMQSQKEYVDYIKKDMEVQKVELDQLKADKQKSAEALDDAREAKQQKISQLQQNKEDLKQQADALQQQEQDESEKIQTEIARIEEENKKNANNGSSSNITFAGGQFTWPVPGYNIITTMYGEIYDPFNTGKARGHTGTDISGSNVFGKPIVAMQDGKIIVANYGWNGGYGNYVIIDHGKSQTDGNTYRTLYGHATELAVTAGQYVHKGDTIAYVGSTGYSTGPHCHVEIWCNGVRGAILDYFKGMTITYHGRTYQY